MTDNNWISRVIRPSTLHDDFERERERERERGKFIIKTHTDI